MDNNNKPQIPSTNQNRAIQPINPASNPPAKAKPAGSPQKPGPSNRPVSTNKVQDAHVSESGSTAVFDKIKSEKVKHKPEQPDGTYNYTGRDIKSSRQKFMSPDEDISVERSRVKNKDEIIERRGGGLMSGVVKALLYIIGVVLVSGILAFNAIMMANDAFAFVKDDVSAEVTLPENANIKNIADILSEHKMIRYPGIFKIYAGLRGKDKNWEFVGGETFMVSSGMAYDDFISIFRVKPAAREVIRIAFPEGFTVDQIIDRLIEHGIGTRSKYIDVINNNKFEYKFLEQLYETQLSPDRKYVLEGYLFPDTYDFYTDEGELSVITKFLNNFHAKFHERYYERLAVLDMTVDDIINLAAMIEREAFFAEDFGKVSAVFHNRMLSPNPDFSKFQSDATILYDLPEHKEVTQADLAIDSPYNTYTRDGFPPSAICNPGTNAIYAALVPYDDPEGNDDWTTYYYFVSMPDGTKRWGKNFNQHLANRAERSRMLDEIERNRQDG